MSEQWTFPSNQADEDEGLANAGIETFRDAPYSGIARECGQNSLDAATTDGERSERVKLSFKRSKVEVASVPDVNQLGEVISCCLRSAVDRGEEKEREFFARATTLLEGRHLDILEISDTGTVGLRGPSTRGTPFHALVKASGVSNKMEKSSGGSFGIGKNAAYAISSLRTVFYSTIYENQGQDHFLAQGKAILVSHQTKNGESRKASGYWGAPDFKPVENNAGLPEWLHRTERGTTVAAVGFTGADDWHFQVAESLVRNFFAAIHLKKISFEVDGMAPIDDSTVGALFDDPGILEVAEANGYAEDLGFSASLHKCLVSPNTITREVTIESLGAMRLRLLVEDGLQKRVAILRNGMYITSSLQHFGDKLARFAMQRDFVAIVEPIDKDTSVVIRSLENPRHDELSHERIENLSQQRKIRRAFGLLIDWLRDEIRSETTSPPEEEIVLDEMNQFFATAHKADRIPNSESDEDDPETSRFAPIQVRRKDHGPRAGGADGGGGGRKKNSTDDGRSSGDGKGSGQGGRGKRGSGSVPVTGLRNQLGSDGSRRRRKFLFTPGGDGDVTIEVFATGMSESVPLGIRSINGELTNGRRPTITVANGERIVHELEFFTEYDGPVELSLVLVEKAQ